MSLINIASLIEKVAPLLASVITGPAGIAVTAISLVANLFGANPKDPDDIIAKMTADPTAALKLKQLEIDHEEFLVKSKNDALAGEYSDRASARELDEAYIAKTGHENFMIIFLVVMLFASIAAGIYCMIEYNNAVSETIAFMLGTFREELKNVYNMYFGGSIGDDDSQPTKAKLNQKK
jgi:hypothetical protein